MESSPAADWWAVEAARGGRLCRRKTRLRQTMAMNQAEKEAAEEVKKQKMNQRPRQ